MVAPNYAAQRSEFAKKIGSAARRLRPDAAARVSSSFFGGFLQHEFQFLDRRGLECGDPHWQDR